MEVGIDPRLGTELLGYRIEELIGRGGMGVVYRAYDPRLKRNVALKLLAPELASDERFRERFLSETELAAGLEHPNVVPIHDAGEVEGQLYLVMRNVEGSDLKRLLAEEGPLELARAISICTQIAHALDVAHAHGLVHRDVKPSNVLLDEREHAYLADFGLTRRLSDQASGFDAGLSLGTPAYVAPEEIEGKEVDGRADQYSLGCLLYECLTGRPPFPRASEAATLFAHLEDEPPAPPGLEEVMAKALAKDPARRYPTCVEFVDDARQALGIAEARRTRWPLAVSAIAVALIGAALLAFLLTRGADGPEVLPAADTLIRIDPDTNTVVDRIPVGRKASGVAVGAGHVWVTNFDDGNVWRIHPETGDRLRISTQGSPSGVAFGGGSAIVANGPQHSVVVVDGATGAVDYVATLPGEGNGTVRVAADETIGWFADPATLSVGKIADDLRSGGPAERIQIPRDETSLLSAYESFDGLAVGAGALWVAGDGYGRTVWRINPADGNVVAAIGVPFIPGGIAAGEGAIWVTSLLDDTVSRIDPGTNRLVETVRVGRGVHGIAAGGGAVWVANSIDGTVSRIDPRTNEVVATVRVGSGRLEEIAVGPDGVWVTARMEAAELPAEDEIAIGILSNCVGPFAQLYDLTLAGAELALIERGGRLAGPRPTDGVEGLSIGKRPVRLFFGCADITGASAIVEARRLVEHVGVDILVGAFGEAGKVALLEYGRRRPEIAFVNGVSSGIVLDPPPNFFSFHTDAAQWMAGLGDYAYRELGWRTAVMVADERPSSLFNWTQVAGFVAEFCSLGGTIADRIWIPPGAQDYSDVIARVPSQNVDGFVVATGPDVVVALARGHPALRGNLSRKLLPGALALFPEIARLGDRASGLIGGGAIPYLPATRPYVKAFREAFPRLAEGGGGEFDIFYYEAMVATLQGLDAVEGDLSDGGKRFMAALAEVELDAPGGAHTTLDADRQAIAPNYLLRFDPPFNLRVIKEIPRVERTFNGYFGPDDPPPSKSTPACKHGNPPPWARR